MIKIGKFLKKKVLIMLIDTHCHMNMIFRTYHTKEKLVPLAEEEKSLCKVIVEQASENQVSSIINVGTDLIESETCIEIGKLFPNCFSTIGLHPNDAKEDWQAVIDQYKVLLEKKNELKIVGIGECGIDKHYPGYNLQRQKDVFKSQIQLAIEHDLAIVVHSRDADQETYESLAEFKGEKNFKGTIHCFSSDENYAKKYIDLGFVLGIGGTVTYPKNLTGQNVVRETSLDHIILETDSPFLPPQPIRGKKNSPAQIKTIAEHIAELKNCTFEEVATITTKNARQLFGI